MASGMRSKQMYLTEQLCDIMSKAWGEGRVSANVERVIRAHLANPDAEKKIRLQELNQLLSRFNADYNMRGELSFPE